MLLWLFKRTSTRSPTHTGAEDFFHPSRELLYQRCSRVQRNGNFDIEKRWFCKCGPHGISSGSAAE